MSINVQWGREWDQNTHLRTHCFPLAKDLVMYVCVCITDHFCYIAETNTILPNQLYANENKVRGNIKNNNK